MSDLAESPMAIECDSIRSDQNVTVTTILILMSMTNIARIVSTLADDFYSFRWYHAYSDCSNMNSGNYAHTITIKFYVGPGHNKDN